MQSRFILLMFVMVFPMCVFAQSGAIKGSVKDGTSGEAVVGANVVIAGTAIGNIADINGEFQIPKVKAGTYTLIISFISYKTDTIKNVTVYPDQTTVIDTKLFEETTELTEVVVTGAKVTNTDLSVITEIRKADLVAVGISSQQISMSQDRDAAQIAKRIPGVTIIGGRFINVRGLNERYNTVLLNGIIAPSSEVDTKAFSFDLIPSSMIDRMMVYKSGSPELPGEFAGAVINIDTKSTVDDNSLSINFTGGFRAGTTFGDFQTYKGSGTDWLGFDNGTRQLPSDFPSQNLGNLLVSEQGVQQLTEASKSLSNNWSTQKKTAMPDFRTTINYSHIGTLFGKRLSNVTAFNYSNTRQRIEESKNYYDDFNETTKKSPYRYAFRDVRDMTNVRVGIISNFILELNPSNKIEFRNLFNQMGMSQVTTREGVEQVNGWDNKNLALNYLQRSIYLGQVSGKHSLTDRLNANWTLAYASTNADQPDYRRTRSQRPTGTNEPFAVQVPSNASTLDAGRFYSELSEHTYTNAVNFDYKLNPGEEETKQSKVSFGYYAAYTERDFSARWFAYSYSRPDNVPNQTFFEQHNFQNIFVPANIGFSSTIGSGPYFILKEGTNFTDKYDANNIFGAGYASVTFPIGAFRVASGVRYEYNRQELNSYETSGKPLTISNPISSILPFMNVAYNINEKHLVRIAYSKTVNRPVFRELAPFNFYDFDRNANLYGNPDLKTADIHNIDLRWENYPSKSESITVGIFYKHFINPIEQELVGGSNLIYTFTNAKSAQSFGAEVEVRKSFASFTNNNFLQKFSTVLNAAIIDSEINLGNVTNQEQKRAMQGQSPYIINASLAYNDVETGWQANVSYNVFGKRIFAVGDNSENRDQYEMPRNQLDFTVSKTLGQRFEIKAGIQDILNQKYRLIQDSDRDHKINNVDETIQDYRPGQYVNLGVTYRIY